MEDLRIAVQYRAHAYPLAASLEQCILLCVEAETCSETDASFVAVVATSAYTTSIVRNLVRRYAHEYLQPPLLQFFVPLGVPL